jgi:hypothetical protein
MDKKIPRGIVVFGAMLIIGSLYETSALFLPRFFTWYKSLFPGLPASLLFVRLLLSVVRRGMGAVLGVGLLFRKRILQKMAVWWSFFILATLYWRHPLSALYIHTQFMLNFMVHVTGDNIWTQGHMVQRVTIGSLIALFLGDIIFWSALICYLWRPATKAWFRQG